MVRARACVLPLLVGACAAPAQWEKPGASSEDAGLRQNRAFQQCMRDKGYNASE